jgi:hypothetical protein
MGDGLGDDVIRGEQEIGQSASTVSLHDLVDTGVVLVVRADLGEQEARVEEDHSVWPP